MDIQAVVNFIKETVLADRDNCKQVADKLKYLWVKDVLSQTGMNLDNCFPEEDSDDPTIEQRAQLRNNLEENDILIIDKKEFLKIYIQDQLIAEWIYPKFILKKSVGEINPKKKLYVEINLEYWSVFSENQ